MSADRADLGSLGADHDMTAITALPNLNFTLGKDFLRLHIVQQGAVALFMMLFDSGNSAELCSKLVEALPSDYLNIIACIFICS